MMITNVFLHFMNYQNVYIFINILLRKYHAEHESYNEKYKVPLNADLVIMCIVLRQRARQYRIQL